MKIAPLMQAIDKHNRSSGSSSIEPILVHTGQHYDYEMSETFFEDLELPEPDIYLGIGSGTHAEQTGRVMIELEKVLFKEKPDLVVVVGDVNSTLAAAIAAVKLHIPVAHVEAGLRMYDLTMPEEVNRLLTDDVSDYLFTPSPDADENLRREGIPEERIFLVGNIMVDSLLSNKERAANRQILHQLGLEGQDYAVLTFHRPDNVDDEQTFSRIILTLREVSEKIPIVFPIHPRTSKNVKEFGLENFFRWLEPSRAASIGKNGIYLTAPLGYLDFLKLMMNSKFVMTDSGGIQAETTVLNIPCLTLYRATGWTVTITKGTNLVVGTEPVRIIEEALKILEGKGKGGGAPKLWDGKTAERIVDVLIRRNLKL